MGIGAGQAAALTPDIGRAKSAMESIFHILDLVKFKLHDKIKTSKKSRGLIFCIFTQTQKVNIGSTTGTGKEPDQIEVRFRPAKSFWSNLGIIMLLIQHLIAIF